MVICYARTSKPSALRLAGYNHDVVIARRSEGDVNWGRARAATRLNPDIGNATNKRIMCDLFQEHNVPAPKLLTHDETFAAVAQGKTVVGRPDRHTGGRGFWLIKTPSDLRRAVRGTRRKRAATHFMDYIPKELAPREYRVHVVGGKSIRISEKLFGSHGETSHGDYTTIKPTHNIKHVRKAAKQAMAAVGLDFGAVDVLANDNACWVLEVNAAPGIGGTLPTLYAEAFRRQLEGGVYDNCNRG